MSRCAADFPISMNHDNISSSGRQAVQHASYVLFEAVQQRHNKWIAIIIVAVEFAVAGQPLRLLNTMVQSNRFVAQELQQ